MTAADGTHTLRRSRGSTDHLPERNDLTYNSDQWWTVTVDDADPVVHAITEASVSLERPGWSVSTHGTISIIAGPAFEVTVGLVATHDGAEVFRRGVDGIHRSGVGLTSPDSLESDFTRT